MNNTKGNQKHLTLSQRIKIEKGLNDSRSFAEIARELEKDPSTISKEVRKHRAAKARNNDFAAIPCANRSTCSVRYLCSIECLLEKKVYVAKYADDCYREMLISSREGINQTAESMKMLDDLVSPLIKKGQAIAHIYAHHAEEIHCSRRTLYIYINKSIFSASNLDLRRRVKYRPRKKATQKSIINREFRNGRTYDDFQKLLKVNPSLSVVEMDTVEGLKGGKVLLTMMFRNCSLMLAFLLETKTQKEVRRVFDKLTGMLGIEIFQSLFPVILTDNGVEFQDPLLLEYTAFGEMRTLHQMK